MLCVIHHKNLRTTATHLSVLL
uniref:Uncharacterized protein n=1 Tax=Arundo donax TaxID=35708 RepID=A0A0A8YXH8_ARUDO